ncbi:MAG: thioredoxin family protein [Leptospiraceae bacterium]|nr:thioredoxin family protein [Leptospiraceae bacterium]MCP5510886.1 thioredoxin family protein [Leptospiraceae bacterium]
MLVRLFLILVGLLVFACGGRIENSITVEEEFKIVQAKAKNLNRKTLILFGADWCPDCKAMRGILAEKEVADILNANYEFMYVDVGKFDKNLEFAGRFHNPIQKGIPAFVILSPSGELLVSTNNGEFSKARKMPSEAVGEFLLKF